MKIKNLQENLKDGMEFAEFVYFGKKKLAITGLTFDFDASGKATPVLTVEAEKKAKEQPATVKPAAKR